MKYGKICRTLAVTIILALLAIVIPATPALAANITLTPSTGKIGDDIDVSGYAFTSGTLVYFYFSSGKAFLNDYLDAKVSAYKRVGQALTGSGVDNAGELETFFEVPDSLTDGSRTENVLGGTYYVYVVHAADTNKTVRAVAEFTVKSTAKISIDPEEGAVGTEVTIAGSGFRGRENIAVECDGRSLDITSGDEKTKSNGAFECAIIIPPGKVGEHTLTVTDKSGSEAEAIFTVEPQASIEPTSGVPGDTVKVSGTGFGASSDVTVSISTTKLTKKTDKNGTFEISFAVPELNPGPYTVEAKDKAGNLAQREFTVKIVVEASISSTKGSVSSEITVKGSGFVPKATVTIKYDTTQITTTPANDKGAFSATFTVPKSKFGEHTIIASDGKNTKQFTFTMESEAPAVPAPLKPELDVKVKPPGIFDWNDVTDPSGVTYTFQIATSKEFTEGSLVIDKPGLTQSEYTLTEELEPRSKKAPYYWRVRAVDGASNQSNWSGIRTFVTGSSFSAPEWGTYGLFAIGALVLFVLGFWIGRKSAYY